LSAQVVITAVELPSVQSRGPQQHSVLFAGVNTSLKPDDIELVTGIQPESAESCEQGLVVKLKSMEDRDKMLALSGHIILRQGRVCPLLSRCDCYSFDVSAQKNNTRPFIE
jgi:hypothetical protein